MNSRWLLCFALFATYAAELVGASVSEKLPFVSPVFGDNMVLQRDRPNAV